MCNTMHIAALDDTHTVIAPFSPKTAAMHRRANSLKIKGYCARISQSDRRQSLSHYCIPDTEGPVRLYSPPS